MRKIKKMVALTAVWVLAFGCAVPAGTKAEAKAAPDAKTAPAPAKVAPAPAAPAKPTPPPAAPAQPAPPAAAPSKPAPPAAAPAAPAKVPEQIVKSWDFRNLEQSKWFWKIPGANKAASPKGAVFTIDNGGVGPRIMNVGVKAGGVSAVRAHLTAARKGKDGKEVAVQPKLILYWAREGDVKAAKKAEWPFDLKRAAELLPVKDQPGVFEVKLAKEENWNEVIKCFYVGLDIPAAAANQAKACTVTFGGLDLIK